MRIHVVMALATFLSGALCSLPESDGTAQSLPKVWGQTSLGLRCAISVEKMPASKGSPFLISFVLENVSGTKVDLKAITSFRLVEASSAAEESGSSPGLYWCPVNLADPNPKGKTGTIIATQSHLVIDKGAAIRATVDLTRYGWDKSTSSFWPVRDFDTVVNAGKYYLRLDIQVESGANPKWVHSNQVDVVVKT